MEGGAKVETHIASIGTVQHARAGTQFSKLAFRQIWYEELLGTEHQITYYHQRFPIPVVLNLRTQVTYYKKNNYLILQNAGAHTIT